MQEYKLNIATMEPNVKHCIDITWPSLVNKCLHSDEPPTPHLRLGGPLQRRLALLRFPLLNLIHTPVKIVHYQLYDYDCATDK